MSCAKRIKLKSEVVPHVMAGHMMHGRMGMMPTTVHLPSLPMHMAAPLEGNWMRPNASGVVAPTQDWKANIDDAWMPHQKPAATVTSNMHARPLLTPRAGAFMDPLDPFEDGFHRPIAPLRKNDLLPAMQQRLKYQRHNKVLARLGGGHFDNDPSAWHSGANRSAKAALLVQDEAAVAVRNWWRQQLGSNWEVGDQLGYGSSGLVWEVTGIAENKKYAGKLIQKKKRWTDEEHFSKCQKEVAMQKLMQAEPYGPNDHVVKVESDMLKLRNGDLMVIEELMPGGNLLDKLEQLREDRKLKDIFRQIVAGVKEMHEAGVVHRDLKLQNIFCNEDRLSPICKIGDFGLATTFPLTPEEQKQGAGSPAFTSPEIHRSHFEAYEGKEADVWALGVVLYRMLFDRYPFEGGKSDLEKTDEAIAALVAGAVAHTTDNLAEVGSEASNLISHMLDVNPNTRYTMQQVAEDPFLAGTP